MATKSRTSKKRRSKRSTLRYFFWDGRLHKVIRINRPANLVDAWCYADHKRVTILYSDYRTKAKPAITTGKACQIMRLTRRTFLKILTEGHIHPPERSYPFDKQDKELGYSFWSEENLMELHDYLMTVHIGRPRKDGLITPSQRIPTKAEIRAQINGEQTLYIKSEDGAFVPLFEPPKF